MKQCRVMGLRVTSMTAHERSLHEDVAFQLNLGGPEGASMHTSRERLFQAEGRAHAKALRQEQPVEYEGGKKKGEEETREVAAKELAPSCGQEIPPRTI